ncbi:MAG: hypothetical protein Q8876_02150 [Bacillota bacterium]|nr:hypothetical protein [Bacillota bacterium]
MLLSFISAIFCFLAAVVMFMPFFKSHVLLKPIAVFFLFQGIWILVSYFINQIWKGNEVASTIGNIGTIVIVGYILVCLFINKQKITLRKKKSHVHEKESDLYIK